MSDDFDKEAERERLREKYEADSEGREVTERMSQLLLQGATMTNMHCETCGSPIFRYQGQEFCPTCQAEAQAADDGQATGSAETGTAESAGDGSTADAGATGTAGGTSNPQTTTESTKATENSQAAAAHESVGAPATGTAELGGASRSQRTAATNQAGKSADATGTSAAVTDSLADTITSLSERARGSEDPRQAKTLLEAAREAAETLVTLQER